MPGQELQQNHADKEINLERFKEFVTTLDAARNIYPTLVSLCIPPEDSLPVITRSLDDRISQTWTIDPRVHRLAVLSALETAKQCIVAHVQIPANGLAIYSGEICDLDGGNERKICIHFEPYKRVTTRHFHVECKFNTDLLSEMLAVDGI